MPKMKKTLGAVFEKNRVQWTLQLPDTLISGHFIFARQNLGQTLINNFLIIADTLIYFFLPPLFAFWLADTLKKNAQAM